MLTPADTAATLATTMVEGILQDLRYAIRTFRAHPGLTLVIVATLTIGIGANTAIFSLVDVLMLRPLPVRDPQQLVELRSRYPGDPPTSGFDWKYYEHFRDRNHVFSNLIGFAPSKFQMDGESVDGATVVGSFFGSLGIEPAIGRLITPQDQQAVAVVSWSFWKNKFDLDPAIVGKRIVIDGNSATIIGVAPRGFIGLDAGSRRDLWIPAKVGGQLTVVGRLRPGVSIEQAQAEMSVLDRARVEDLARDNSDPKAREFRIEVTPAAAGLARLRDDYSKPGLVLMGIVGLLLLVACANVAGLLLARAAARKQEMSLRVSLGASSFRLIQQVLTESLLLFGAGGLLGILLAWWGSNALVQIIASGRLREPISMQIQPDLRMLLFTAGTAIVTGLLFGLVPAVHALHASPASALKERHMFGKGLVVTQVALSVVLLSAAGLFAAHLSRLRGPEIGFKSESVLLVDLDPPTDMVRDERVRGYKELLRRLKTIPAIQNASLSAVTPIQGGGAPRFANVEGFSERLEDRRYLHQNWIAPEYFKTLGTPILAGRDFEFSDEGRPRVAIVNKALARYYFGNDNPLGKHVTFLGDKDPYEIIGVVGDAKFYDPREITVSTIYLNAFQQRRILSDHIVLRTSVKPTAVSDDVRRVVGDVFNNVPVAKVTPLAAQIDETIVAERLIARMSGLFGALGAVLAALGLYGLSAFMVTRRVHEIGIRMALGATRRDVTQSVLKNAFGLVLAGLAVGAPIAWWGKGLAARLIEKLPLDSGFPIAFSVASMIVVALVAAYLPSRRAARIDPMEALRHD